MPFEARSRNAFCRCGTFCRCSVVSRGRERKKRKRAISESHFNRGIRLLSLAPSFFALPRRSQNGTCILSNE
jgi:hypothetical protein